MDNKFWYAVMENREDWDWGTGSHDFQEAIRMSKRNFGDSPDQLIAVIDESGNEPMCVREIGYDEYADYDD